MSKLINVIELSKKHCQHPIQCQLVYATPYNLVGRIIEGYHSSGIAVCLLTKKPAMALCEVQNFLIKEHNFGLMVYDAYRPRRAVLDFMKWSQQPVANDFELVRKALHYPHIEKNQLFELGYISKDSNHCYGNTVDVFLTHIKDQQVLDMGAIFDYMDPLSHHSTTAEIIGKAAFQHRRILMTAMERYGFEPYECEFWHYAHGGKTGREVAVPIDIEINYLNV